MITCYVIHCYGGDDAMLDSAELWAAWLTERFNALFVVPWVPLCKRWPDTGEHRRVGLEIDLAALERCDRAIAVRGGANLETSPGGSREWQRAAILGLRPLDFSRFDTPWQMSLNDPGATQNMALLEREFGRRQW